MMAKNKRGLLMASVAAAGVAVAGLTFFIKKFRRVQPPREIEPLPEDRAYDREKNIEHLKENYPAREYNPPEQASADPNGEQPVIEKDKPLRGFHGG
jgi:hypothetical protein